MKVFKRAQFAVEASKTGSAIYSGDCFDLINRLPDSCVDLTFTSPPYCIGKDYESSTSVSDFLAFHKRILPEIVRVTKPGGSICWQVGYHSLNGQSVPLDCLVYAILAEQPGIFFRNRIIWTFEHGLHRKKRFSGRHEMVLWFTKGEAKQFNLDAVRVPQKYPGKKSYKGPNKGQLSGNPLGKNPGDVWSDIPNVKGHHVEKLEHPCQFPIALPQRFIRAIAEAGDLIFDPFMGVGSTGVAALLEKCRFLGAEIQTDYVAVARQRLTDAGNGTAKLRPLHQPIYEPVPGQAVSTRPAHFRGGVS